MAGVGNGLSFKGPSQLKPFCDSVIIKPKIALETAPMKGDEFLHFTLFCVSDTV